MVAFSGSKAIVKSVGREYKYENPHGEISRLRMVVVTDDAGNEVSAAAWGPFADKVRAGGKVRVLLIDSSFTVGEATFVVTGIVE